jgi:hypothetical protein
MGQIVERQSPLYLLFTWSAGEVIAGVEDLLRSSDRRIAKSLPPASHSDYGLVWNGLQFTFSASDWPVQAGDAQAIFCSKIDESNGASFALNFSDHVAGGNRIPELAKAFLQFAAILTKHLGPARLYWTPANLLVSPDYFVDSVTDYAEGGAFPVLSTIDLAWQQEEDALQTTGLDWFAGQEIRCAQVNADRQNWLRRVVRLVHDIATNGPMIADQNVPDLDESRRVSLVVEDGGLVMCTLLGSEMEVVQTEND